MSMSRWVPAAALVGATLTLGAPVLAQDASTLDASDDAMSTDDASTHMGPVCPDAITSADGNVVFHRMGPVDFGPGTGMSSIGDHSTLGLDYNLLFSGNYDTQMQGHLHLAWPRALSVTAIPDPMGGYLDVTFGLRMMATLWVAGVSIPLPLDYVIDDHEGHCHIDFNPWRWTYETPQCHLDVSAWRTLYSTSVDVAGSTVNFDLQMRYNVDANVRTIEIGFPDRTSTASVMPNLSQITQDMPVALVPPPRDGNLDLLTRWKGSLRYQGSFEFRINPSCADPLDLVCRAATGLLGSVLRPLPTPPVVTSTDTLPDPYDNSPHFDLPVQQVDRMEVDFGDIHIGESASDMFTITSAGRSTLAADVLPSTMPEYTVGPGGCIPAGGMLTVPVTFHPTSVGQFQTEITVQSNGTLGTPAHVTLYGRGVMGPTHRPTNAGDGGVRGDGSLEYRGSRVEAGCGCRTAGRANHSNTTLWVGLGGLAAALVSRRRR